RQYFLDYDECMSNDFVMSGDGKRVELLRRDIVDWQITFVDTGLHSNIGQRLLRVREYLRGEECFLANYADGLTDLPLDSYIAEFSGRDVVASFVAVRPPQSFHAVLSDDDGYVTSFGQIRDAAFAINAGFFCLRHDIFDYIEEGE